MHNPILNFWWVYFKVWKLLHAKLCLKRRQEDAFQNPIGIWNTFLPLCIQM